MQTCQAFYSIIQYCDTRRIGVDFVMKMNIERVCSCAWEEQL